jgi:hypothetical protein
LTYEYKVPRTPPSGSASVVSGTDSDDISRALKTDAAGRLEVILGAAGAAASPNKVEDTAASTGDTGVATMAIQKASPADLATEGDYAFEQMSEGAKWTARKPMGGSGAALTPVPSAALETSRVIKASAGNLYGLNLKTTSAAGTFLVHNSATAPAAGAVTPIKAYDCAANSSIEVGFDPPLRFGTGISVTFSTAATPFTQTDSATAFISGDAV